MVRSLWSQSYSYLEIKEVWNMTKIPFYPHALFKKSEGDNVIASVRLSVRYAI